MLWMTRHAISKSPPGTNRIAVALYVRNNNRPAKLVTVIATCGPRDVDKPEPVITLLMPDED